MDEKRKQRETDIALSYFDWPVKKRILEAMRLVKETHELPFRQHGHPVGKYKRAWRVDRHPGGEVSFSYDGTPDKGFVIVDSNYNVRALDQAGKLIKIIP